MSKVYSIDTLGACSIKTLWMLKLKLACLFDQAGVHVQASVLVSKPAHNEICNLPVNYGFVMF